MTAASPVLSDPLARHPADAARTTRISREPKPKASNSLRIAPPILAGGAGYRGGGKLLADCRSGTLSGGAHAAGDRRQRSLGKGSAEERTTARLCFASRAAAQWSSVVACIRPFPLANTSRCLPSLARAPPWPLRPSPACLLAGRSGLWCAPPRRCPPRCGAGCGHMPEGNVPPCRPHRPPLTPLDPLPCPQVKTVSPVGDRVLVKAEEAEAKTVGGILLPSSAQKRPTQGTVSAAGSAKAVKVGAAAIPPSHAPRLSHTPAQAVTVASARRPATRWSTPSMPAPSWRCRATPWCCSRCGEASGATLAAAGRCCCSSPHPMWCCLRRNSTRHTARFAVELECVRQREHACCGAADRRRLAAAVRCCRRTTSLACCLAATTSPSCSRCRCGRRSAGTGDVGPSAGGRVVAAVSGTKGSSGETAAHLRLQPLHARASIGFNAVPSRLTLRC